jgi:histidine ammonia-lyase
MVDIGSRSLSLQDFSDIVIKSDKISLNRGALDKVNASYEFLAHFSTGKLIYGINTGFGPMAQYKISDENRLKLQYNLIRSHSSGMGRTMSPLLGKAVLVARLNSLMQAHSGIHTSLVELLAAMINQDIIPCIYEHGGVGASGDLVQLAHVALNLIGEGKLWYEGQWQAAPQVFQKTGLKPLEIRIREGISVINGTSAMTGIGLVNIVHAKKLMAWSVMLSSMTNEIVEAYDDHYSKELNIVKHHYGQNYVAAMMRGVLKGSKMIHSRTEHLYNPANIEHDVFEDKVQEYYSLRCVTQVLGPIYDTIEQAEKILVEELNSVNDNPVIDHLNKNIFHGGNFHGDYVSLEMDKLKIAITKLSMLAERQLNYLLNEKLNQILPPFVNLGVMGLNFGMQGLQFTAVSTVAENQTLSNPMYVHSIPNNNDNQDIVSMGCNAALMTRKVIDNAFEVLTIQAMTIVQALDYLNCQEKLSPATHRVNSSIRKIFPKFIEDSPKYEEQEKVKNWLIQNDPL